MFALLTKDYADQCDAASNADMMMMRRATLCRARVEFDDNDADVC